MSRRLEFISRNKIIPECQHGFTVGKSFISNLLDYLNDWTLNIDHNCPTDVIYIDLARVFDKVHIKRLLLKLEHFGVREELLQWIDTYLSNRYFCDRMDNSLSESQPVLSGVPQGFVLSPLLFLLCVGDIHSHFSTIIEMFADDTKLYANPLTDYNQLCRELEA